jgi:hypothetical protein
VSAWAFGFYRRFGSVYSVFQYSGFQKMTPIGFLKLHKPINFGSVFYFGFSVKTEKTDGIKQQTANRFQN